MPRADGDRHRPGYHLERELKDKEKRREAKKVEWDEEKEAWGKREREQWRYDLKGFLKNVMPNSFPLEFSDSHKQMIEKMEEVILRGGKSADAQPRGSGKTTISTGAFMWAVLYGHKRYGAVIGNEADAAKAILESVKTEIWLGGGIGKYWPKLQAYIERGDGQSNKFRHLLNHDFSPTMIKWGADHIRLPTTPKDDGDEWSGAVLHACGITGRIRGMFIKLSDGTIMRPDFVLIDDPQTRESAKSVTQITDRENTILGDIMGLSGPGKEISAFMAMTVIYPNDLACRFLDKSLHPTWRARKVPMLISWPDEIDGLWQDYDMLRKSAMKEEREPTEAWDFYREHREEMDKGAKVYWEERKYKNDVSAIQHAMNLWFDDPNSFLAEYQNEPVQDTGGAPYVIEPMNVMEATNGKKRLVVPDDCPILVTMTDINYSGLNTVVVASTNNAVRYIVDYQTYPGGGVPLYAKPERGGKIGQSEQIAIARGLDNHIPQIASKRYMRNGQLVSPDLVLIDCGFNMDLVFRWCEAARHKLGCALYPERGRAYNKYRPTQVVGKPGDNFHVADWPGRGRVLVHNADQWRMKAQKGFLLPTGVPGSLSVFGKKATEHKRFADEICAEVLQEYIEMTEGGNSMFVWGNKVGVSNDLLDALVGAVAGTSYLGASETGLGARPMRRPKRKAKRAIGKIRI